MSEPVRIRPLDPPYDPGIEAMLIKWMPPNSLAPLAIFRTIARHPMLLERMRPLGSGILGHGTLPLRVRELLILRTCARCGAEYEWGVHVTAFATTAGLSDELVQTTTAASEELAARTDDDALVLRVADELHDTSTLSDELFTAVQARWGDRALLEMTAVAGFYHLISYLLRTARTSLEPWAARFPAM